MKRKLMLAVLAALAVAGGKIQADAEPLVALTTNNRLLSFDSATPGVITTNAFITGLAGGESLVGIDRRPANGQIYGITTFGNIYTLNALTGVATFQSTTTTAPTGSSFGVDFNPVPDRLRVTSDVNQNLRINVDNGMTIVDGNLNPGDPTVTGSAYTNNFAGTTTTTLYAIGTATDELYIQNPPNDGALVPVGSLGFNAENLVGFDISGTTGAAFAAFTAPNGTFSSLYQINLGTGAASLIGTIGGGVTINGLAAQVGAPVPEPATMILLGTGLTGLVGAARRRRRAQKE